MFEQTAKQVVDVGELGNASTGDILYDGGVKINDNFSAIYNAFGDQRYYSSADGEGNQKIYATGYYQKLTAVSYVASAVDNGTCHDIDTSSGAVSVRLSKGKLGEAVYFVNSNGSFSKSNPLKIIANDSFTDGSAYITISNPFSRVECWCTEVEADGTAVWSYKLTSMFGDDYSPIQGTYSITSDKTTITICTTDYAAIKLLISAGTSDGEMRRTSEVLLMIDSVGDVVYNTEYAVLKFGDTNDADDLYSISYSIDANSNVIATVTTTKSNVRFSVQSLTTQKFGVAE